MLYVSMLRSYRSVPCSFCRRHLDLPCWMLHGFVKMRCANTVWLVGEQLLADATVVPRVAVPTLTRICWCFFSLFFFFIRFEGFSGSVPLCTLCFIHGPSWYVRNSGILGDFSIAELESVKPMGPRFSHVSSCVSPWLWASRTSRKHRTILRAAWLCRGKVDFCTFFSTGSCDYSRIFKEYIYIYIRVYI